MTQSSTSVKTLPGTDVATRKPVCGTRTSARNNRLTSFFCSKRCTFFLLQALHGIKPSRVTSKSTDINIAQTQKTKRQKQPQTTPSDANPPSQDWSPSKKRPIQGQYNSAGRQASPMNVYPQADPSCTIKNQPKQPSETPGMQKYIAPGGQKHASKPVMTTDVILSQ